MRLVFLFFFLFVCFLNIESFPTPLLQDQARRHGGRVHLPARLHQHHSAAVPRGPPQHQLLQRERLHALPGPTAAGTDR